MDSDEIVFLRPREMMREGKIRTRGPFIPKGIPHEYTEIDEEWMQESVLKQIERTFTIISSTNIRDDELGYYIIELETHPYSENALKIYKKLGAEIIGYINRSSSKLLIESKLSIMKNYLESKHLKYVENNIKIIRPLFINEIIDIDKIFREKDEEYLNIQVVPSNSSEKMTEYIVKLNEVLEETGIKKEENETATYLESKGIISIKATKTQSERIAQSNNLIYKINGNPKIKSNKIKSQSVSVLSETHPTQILYPVCVMDTGINDVDPIKKFILYNSYEDIFDDPVDIDNHGTPISCLVAFGEGNNIPNSAYGLISHRINSDLLDRGNLFNGVINAINMYKENTKVFLSSTNYEYNIDETKEYAAKLDKIIQENEVCVIFAAGNNNFIDKENYPYYINDYKVNQPNDATSIISVGGIATKVKTESIAPINGPSPFTRIGTESDLQSSIKPEIVHHGGNCCEDGNIDGIGVVTFDQEGRPNFEDVGTSFAAPMVARCFAKIYNSLSVSFNYPETAKAILISSCSNDNDQYCDYRGFGMPNYNNIISSRGNQVKIAFEGKIGLPIEYEEEEVERTPYHTISFNAPRGIRQIRMTLVHTDNYFKDLDRPYLYTFFKVRTYKPGNEKSVKHHESIPYKLSAGGRDFSERSHAKKIIWNYSRNTFGRWTIQLHPDSNIIANEERENVEIRYGGVIELISNRMPFQTITQQFKTANGINS